MSRIQQLPPAIKDVLDRLLRRNVSQSEILQRLEPLLAEAGESPLSKSSLSRYAVRMEAVGARMREARAVAEAWTAGATDIDSESRLGRHIIEMLRTLAFDHVISLDPGDTETPLSAQAINDLALAVQRLENAADLTSRREREIRREVAAQAETEAKKRGISGDTAAALREALQEAA